MTITVQADDLLDNEQAAKLLGVKPNTLENWRHQGKGPAFHKFGHSKQALVRYSRSAITAWLSEHNFASTSAYSPAAVSNLLSNKRRSSGASE